MLDASGRFSLPIHMPAGFPPGFFAAVQGWVFTPAGPYTFRLTTGMEMVIVAAGPANIFVDGDQAGPGTGTPYDPDSSIGAALAAVPPGPVTVHVDDASTAPGAYVEVVDVPSNVHLLGDTWSSLSGARPVLHAPIDTSGPNARGSIGVVNAANVTLEHLEVRPSRKSLRVQSRCIGTNNATNLVIRDCVLTGRARNTLTMRGIYLGQQSSALVELCTITDLEVDPSAVGPTSHAAVLVGIQITGGQARSTSAVVRNCRIQNLLATPVPGITFASVTGIDLFNVLDISIQNNVIGPIVLAQGAADADLMGVNGFPNPNAATAIHNNVVTRLSTAARPGNVQQVIGMNLDGDRMVNWNSVPFLLTNNIVSDLGTAVVNFRFERGFSSPSSVPFPISYSCIDRVITPMGPSFVAGPNILVADPLLDPVNQSLQTGSPCVGTGNPLLPPIFNMGIFGGPYAGPAGAGG
ncbi:MAG: hypothetical protein Fur0037_14320 [Planctomycetota bacterium]